MWTYANRGDKAVRLFGPDLDRSEGLIEAGRVLELGEEHVPDQPNFVDFYELGL